MELVTAFNWESKIAATTQNQLIAKIAKNSFLDFCALERLRHVLLKIFGVIFKFAASGFNGVNRRVIKYPATDKISIKQRTVN